MKKTILVLLLSALAWSPSLESAQGGPFDDYDHNSASDDGPGVGRWIGLAFIPDCDGELCAQWDEPGGVLNGVLCCISPHSQWSTSFDACLELYGGPRPPDEINHV